MTKFCCLWHLQELWHCATGATGRDQEQIEPLTWSYLGRLAMLFWQRKLRLSTFLWALRARPASVCGIGGSYAVADWIQ